MCAEERLRLDPKTAAKVGGPRGGAASSAPTSPPPPGSPRTGPALPCAPSPARIPVSSPRGRWRGRHSLQLPPSAARISYQPSFRTFQAPSFQTPGRGWEGPQPRLQPQPQPPRPPGECRARRALGPRAPPAPFFRPRPFPPWTPRLLPRSVQHPPLLPARSAASRPLSRFSPSPLPAPGPFPQLPSSGR